jgi:methionine-rich copper-binding protein CopC
MARHTIEIAMKSLPFLAALLALAASPALAHPTLQDAAPFPETTTRQPPASIRLTFSEGVVPAFSRITLVRQGGQAVKTGVALKTKDPKVLAVPVTGRLAPGTYKVEWRVVSKDTHRVEGSYVFVLAK